MPKISLIIPTLNEAENIGRLINYLKAHATTDLCEILVVDAQSADNTEGVAQAHGAMVFCSEKRGRAVQMNLGAAQAQGDILYFVHADCYPPTSYCTDILAAYTEGVPLGCYRYRFDSPSTLLKINAYFNRFEPLWCRGGDETLFVSKAVFEKLGGYNTHYCIMEEYDFIRRARRQYPFRIIPKYALVSARKYETNSWLRVQLANMAAFNMFRWGVAPQKIAITYRRLLNHR